MRRFESVRVDALLIGQSLRGIRAIAQAVRPSAFTYVEGNFVGVFGLVLLVGFVPDAFFRHLLVPHRYWLLNGVFDAVELLAALWLCGAFATMVSSPHEIAGDVLHVRFGAFASVAVPLDAVIGIDVFPEPARGLRRLHKDAYFFGFRGTPLVRLSLDREVRVLSYPFVRPRAVRTLFIPSDRPEELARLLRGRAPASA